jgi:hypothetical protein
LQAKALLELANANLGYYDQVLKVNQERFRAGDIARVDLQRLELQRVQFASDFENAKVALRTAKIQMLALMNDKTAIESFDVTGDFDFKETILLPAGTAPGGPGCAPGFAVGGDRDPDKARADNGWHGPTVDRPPPSGSNTSAPCRTIPSA